MIQGLKAFVARHWPVLHFRTIIFGTLLFVAALPGVGAIFLRVYENALVRRTEAELVAQSAALAASAAAMWPGPRAVVPPIKPVYVDNPTEIDLSTSPVLPERPAPLSSSAPTDAAAVAVANKLAPAIAETKLTTLASILVLDRHGIILEGQERGGSLAALPEVRQALVGRPTTVFRQNGAYRQVYPFEWVSRASNLRLHHARPIWIDGKVERANDSYGGWAASAASSGKAFYIDLNEIVAGRYEQMGPQRVGKEFFLVDSVHTSPAGARVNAESVVAGIKQLKNCPLAAFLR